MSSSSSSVGSGCWSTPPEYTKHRAQHWHGKVSCRDRFVVDAHGRTLSLRGVNVCANSKLPTSPPGSTHLSEGFWNHRHVSFIGRPFPLADADEHFARLRSWGLTFIRLLVPWEALEHEGPGIYDEEFIHYLMLILEKASNYGIQCFIDPHQDTWSRFSGGSGAPGWTFEVAGMDLTKFKATGAAHVHQLEVSETDEANAALWPTNYTKLASATMFTLFFGGNIFAPNATYKGAKIQDFLQTRFIECYQYLASRLKKFDAVIGYEVINEPHSGYIGLSSIHKFDPNVSLILGDSPSALESFALGDGMEQEVEVWVKSWPRPSKRGGTRVLNTERESVWLNGQECIWKRHGVWSVNKKGEPVALIPDYFTKHPITGKPINFNNDCYLPFIKMYADAIKQYDGDALIFFEPIPNEDPPLFGDSDAIDNLVYAPHWYDLKTMFTKSFYGIITHDVQGLSKGTKNVLSATYFGLTGANKNYLHQITNITRIGLKRVGVTPSLIGECGIPMDINEKKAFETGDYTHHNNFLDAVINAMEANQLNFTLWNYNPTNDNIYGDHWNGEDFSIYSPKPSPSHSRTTSLNSSFAIAPGSQSSSPSSKSKQAAEAEAVAAAAAAALAKSKRPPPKVLKETNVNDLDIKFTDSPRTVTAGGGATPTTPTTPFEITNAYFDMEGDRAHHQNDGGRALDAIMRTYAAKTAGEPVSMKFDLNRLSFKLEFLSTPEPHPQQDNNNSDSSTPNRLSPRKKVTLGKDPRSYITEIFIPNYHYGSLDGVKIEVSDGEWMYDREKQTLYWKYDAAYRPAGMGGSLYNLLGSSSASSSNAVANSKSSGYAKGGRILHTITITVPESQMRNRPASGIVSSLTTGGIMVAMGAVAVAVMFKFFQQ